jgi:hypothetical protein
VGGRFTFVYISSIAQTRNCLARLNSNGTVDQTFNPAPNNFVFAIASQMDGSLLVGGAFSSICSTSRNHLARLLPTSSSTDDLSVGSTTLSWQLGGMGPDAYRVAADYSTDDFSWHSLGDATRSTNGWQVSLAPSPPGSTYRVRGFFNGGYGNGSFWFVDRILQTRPNIIASSAYFDPLNNFSFDVRGNSGSLVVVEASSDFAFWTPVYTSGIITNVTHFSDPQSPYCPVRFYRARLP